MDAASLSKLNVPQLKAKCKELKLAGYSKFAKVALIEKLVTSTSGASREVASTVEPAAVAQDEPLNPSASSSNTKVGTSRHAGTSTEPQEEAQQAPAPNISEAPKKPAKKRPRKGDGETVSSKKSRKAAAQDTSQPQSTNDLDQQSNPPSAPPSDPPSTLPRPSLNASLGAARSSFQVPLLPARLTQASAVSNAPDTPTGAPPTLTAPVFAPRKPIPSSAARPISKASTPISHSTISSNKTAVKPPKPPSTKSTVTETEKIVNPVPTKTNGLTRLPQTYKPKAFKAPAIIKPARVNSSNKSHPARVHYPACSSIHQSLGFPSPPACTDFSRISMPPSMSRRRQAERMSVVFSGISDSGVLALCVQVSLYLSATHALIRDFPGSRLNAILADIKEPRMTSMWAYFRAQQTEVENRRKIFEQTWLGRCVQREGMSILSRNPTSAQMWTSPDDERQIVVALRFVCTRLVFALARRHDESFDVREWLDATVVGADEIVPNEIWRVTTARTTTATESSEGLRTKLESFYVLFDTGEVIGHAPPLSRNPRSMFGQRVAKGRPHLEIFDEDDGAGDPLRADWAKYIEAVERGDAPSLQDAITSADRESYVCGVSAFWLRSLAAGAEVEDGDLLRKIARRYVLSCVEPNSVSGAYKTVVGMVRELAGGGLVDQAIPLKRQPLGLLVSEHHLVESVHLEARAPSAKARLHSALALILTAPGREYFVLRDTGTPIGTSDEGLEMIWQEILGCDTWGCVSI